MRNKILFFLISIFVFSGCGESDGYIGDIEVKGCKGVVVQVYQQKEFDFVLSVTYRIVKQDSIVLTPKCFLFGTNDSFQDASRLIAKSYDSLIFISYHEYTNVLALYDLKENLGNKCNYADYSNYSNDRDSLFCVLLQKFPELKAGWNQ